MTVTYTFSPRNTRCASGYNNTADPYFVFFFHPQISPRQLEGMPRPRADENGDIIRREDIYITPEYIHTDMLSTQKIKENRNTASDFEG